MNQKPSENKSLTLYATLQSLVLVLCWGWFAALWGVTFLNNLSMDNIEWWLLVISACAGLYGLRPNLEKAIDAAWLRSIKNANPTAISERIAQLRPIKRRIDLIFSLLVLVALLAALFLWYGGFVSGGQSR